MMSREIERIQNLINEVIIKIINTREIEKKQEIHNKLVSYIEICLIPQNVKEYFLRCLIKREIADYFNSIFFN